MEVKMKQLKMVMMVLAAMMNSQFVVATTTPIYYDYEELGAFMRVAARAGDEAFIERVLDVGTPVDGTDINGFTALMWGAYFGRTNVTKLLIDNGADVNHQNKFGETPLILSTASGSVSANEVTDTLLINSANPNMTNIRGVSPLMLAAERNNVEAMNSLLSSNADVEQKNNIGNTALMSAAQMGSNEAIDKLLENDAVVNETNGDGFTAMMWAAMFGQVDAVQTFLDTGEDIDHQNDYGDTALMWAALGGHQEMTGLLLDSGADPNIKSSENLTALMGAAVQGHVEVAESLLDNGADVLDLNEQGTSALTLAIQSGQREIITLLADDSTVHQENLAGTTPLHLTVTDNLTDILPLLLESCPDTTIVDADNLTALELANLLGFTNIANMLTDFFNASCKQLWRYFKVGEATYQNCEKLLCHCTGRWKLVPGIDPRCGSAPDQVLVNQRFH